MQETWVQLIPGSGISHRKGIATHSSILSSEIPWTEEPGKLWSMGSQRVRHNCVTKQQKHIENSSKWRESLICCYVHDYHFLNWPSVLSFWVRKVTFRITSRTFPTCMNAMPNVWIQQSVSFWISLPFLDERSPGCIATLCCDAVECADCTNCAVRLPFRPYINCAEESIDPLGWVAFGYRCTLSSILVSFPKHTWQSFMQ